MQSGAPVETEGLSHPGAVQQHLHGTQGRSGVCWGSSSSLEGKLFPALGPTLLLHRWSLALMSAEEPQDPGLPGAL